MKAQTKINATKKAPSRKKSIVSRYILEILIGVVILCSLTFVVVLIWAMLLLTSVVNAREETNTVEAQARSLLASPETDDVLSNFLITPKTQTDLPNLCAKVGKKSQSIRALPSLNVPPLGSYLPWTIVNVEGTITLDARDNPETADNESISNGRWVKINRGNWIPLDLTRDNVKYAEIFPCK